MKDILIERLTKGVLKDHLESFIQILNNEPFEYWTNEHFLKELPLKYELSQVAFLDTQAVGYIIASKKTDAVYIHKFMVDSTYRDMQIGSRLQKVFEENAMHLGHKSVQLSVIHNNLAALRFYKKNGYTIFEERMDKINNIKLCSMQKTLL